MTDVRPDQRGVVSAVLILSRNLGLVTGASVMGSVFALGAATTNVMTASAQAIATGLRVTFAVAAALVLVALVIAALQRTRLRDAAETGSGPLRVHEQRIE